MNYTTPPGDSAYADSINGLIENTTARLETTSDAPRLEAFRLLASVTGMTTTHMIAHGDQAVDQASRSRLETLLERRARGAPLAYLLGDAGFWRQTLTVNRHVLIPRPETELLVETALARLAADQPLRIADLGTGSGAIAIALAHERPSWQITATDISSHAVETARHNASRNNASNIEFVIGDWFDAVAGQQFNAVIANPPYVAPGDPHLTDPAVAAEPDQALIAADSGNAALTQIIATAPNALAPGGLLMLEHAPWQAEGVGTALQRGGFTQVETKADLTDRKRATLAIAPADGFAADPS
ncbi:peptide chain release factor N(5)-glutamine methyltransferase [Salinisphaera sp. USBA-960]|uniref:peptide chain release factor N(5)-glutamine methyltransferase n=1 Tax=Salinisphaera orenii TaxID=856731 RepID=UPI000DBE3AA8|nr:peptide chain release factor N(5)-glutamine methyltransferase [Salifodinibacter halophilus]NNC25459.1 peptide chain release factor N(5)-glutamine methyltransferase [Salifodinibacter halophilus]